MTTDIGTKLAAMRSYVRNYVNRMAHDFNLAEDIAADAVTSAWEHRDRFQEYDNPKALRAWMFAIARNRFLAHVRAKHQQLHGGSVDDLLAGQLPWMAADQEVGLHLADTMAAFDRLPARNRDALTLVALGDSYQEAAETLGVAVGTIKSSVSRGRDMLAWDLRL